MNSVLSRGAAVLLAVSSFAPAPSAQAPQNGEARATVPVVIRTDYDMQTFVAAPALSATELAGRRLFAQRCANCHGGSAQRPGPPLGRQAVDRLGDLAIRDKVAKGSAAMPGFGYTLAPLQVDQIVAFLKTYTPSATAAAGGPD
jgi:mono/diheme cytochrome c family protein